MEGIEDPNSEVDVEVAVTESVKGVASGYSVTMAYDGVPSPVSVLYSQLSAEKVDIISSMSLQVHPAHGQRRSENSLYHSFTLIFLI